MTFSQEKYISLNHTIETVVRKPIDYDFVTKKSRAAPNIHTKQRDLSPHYLGTDMLMSTTLRVDSVLVLIISGTAFQTTSAEATTYSYEYDNGVSAESSYQVYYPSGVGSGEATVRPKFLVRRLNFVIFEVFEVKFSAKKSIF